MGQKFHVQAVSRQGHDGAWRAGRKWPAGAPTPVEVLDQDEDPEHDPAKGVRVGKQTYELLKADKNLTIRPPGDPLETAKSHEALLAQVEELKAKLARYESQHQATKLDATAKVDPGQREVPSAEGAIHESEARAKRR
jgi:hypothetical protein